MSVKSKHMDGDLSLGRNIAVGGRADVQGDMDIGHDLTVKGRLNVSTIKASEGVLPDIDGPLIANDIHSTRYTDALDNSSGIGYHLWVDGNTSNLVIDNLRVRNKWITSILEVMKLQYSAGNITIDGAGGEIFAVEPFDASGVCLFTIDKSPVVPLVDSDKTGDGDTEQGATEEGAQTAQESTADEAVEAPTYDVADVYFYRCYFKATDGEKHIQNEWHLGDQARCQTFNLVDGNYENAANRMYFRVVIGVSDKVVKKNGVDCFYIDLSNVENGTLTGDDGKEYNYRGLMHTKADDGTVTWLPNDEPEAGDQIAHVGNIFDEERQGAVQLVAVGEDKGLYIYDGINETLENLADFIHIKLTPRNSLINSTFVTITNGYHSNNPYIYCGDWSEGVTAHPSEVWQYNDASWVCNVQTIQAPSSTATETFTKSDGTKETVKAWSTFAKKGEKGDKGDKGDEGESAVTVLILTDNGVTLRQGMTETTMTAHVYLGGEDITATIEPSKFSWTRTSNNAQSDAAWNDAHSGIGNVVRVSKAEIFSRAMFECEVDYQQQ